MIITWTRNTLTLFIPLPMLAGNRAGRASHVVLAAAVATALPVALRRDGGGTESALVGRYNTTRFHLLCALASKIILEVQSYARITTTHFFFVARKGKNCHREQSKNDLCTVIKKRKKKRKKNLSNHFAMI